MQEISMSHQLQMILSSAKVCLYICTCISPNKHNCKRKFKRFLKNGMNQMFLTGKGMQMATELGVLCKMVHVSLAHEQHLDSILCDLLCLRTGKNCTYKL